jgi:Pyridoxamine 5'-phosphate oxidase
MTSSLTEIAPAFVAMAHEIVWCSAATVGADGRPRSRVLHPIWDWDGTNLTGWIATGPTPVKLSHLAAHPYVSLNYWHPSHDTCVAECRATWHFDLDSRRRIWDRFKHAPAPVGYDPAMIPVWKAPEDEAFAVMRLEPWKLRVFPGAALFGQAEIMNWSESA